MKKGIILISVLFLTVSGYTQTNDTTKEESDIFFYCDNEVAAYFPGGVNNWSKAVIKNFRTSRLEKNKTPQGTYKVLVTFMISKKGRIENIRAETNFGYGIEEEVIRAIKKSPKWQPATNCGKKINSYQRQPVIIIVP